MGCTWYLAMTPGEIAGCEDMPPHIGWMACSFSAHNAGVTNLPKSLPAGSLLIFSDQNPMEDHDLALIARQLGDAAGELSVDGVLLDLQRQADYSELIGALEASLPCPLAVTEQYARGNACGVFLSPPLNIPLSQAAAPWRGRQLWLDCAVGVQTFTVTTAGCQVSGISPEDGAHYPIDLPGLHCRLERTITQDRVIFRIFRGKENIDGLLREAEHLQIRHAVSLYKEIR